MDGYARGDGSAEKRPEGSVMISIIPTRLNGKRALLCFRNYSEALERVLD